MGLKSILAPKKIKPLPKKYSHYLLHGKKW